MSISASCRAFLIIVIGLFLGLAAPSQAATDGDTDTTSPAADAAPGAPVKLSDYIKRSSHHAKKHAQPTASRKSPPDKKGVETASGDADHAPVRPAAIPASIANANAQIAAPDTLADPDTPAGKDARAMTRRAATMIQSVQDAPGQLQPATDAEVVDPEQLNDVDRALHDGAPPTAMLAMASAEPPAPAFAAAPRTQPSAWDQTSLVGKIFIGFGALLTLASAARMFMA